jgi:hypothetical protein
MILVLGGMLGCFFWWMAFRAIYTGNAFLAQMFVARRVYRVTNPFKFWWAVSLQLLFGAMMGLFLLTALYPNHFQYVVHVLQWHARPPQA